jgi:hypothetical protein
MVIYCKCVAFASCFPPQHLILGESMMSNRLKLWLGASALALASGALPAAPILSPITAGMLGVDLANEAQAQDSESGEGEGAEAECTTESGEGEEGGATECPEPTGEEGEGEGEGG